MCQTFNNREPGTHFADNKLINKLLNINLTHFDMDSKFAIGDYVLIDGKLTKVKSSDLANSQKMVAIPLNERILAKFGIDESNRTLTFKGNTFEKNSQVVLVFKGNLCALIDCPIKYLHELQQVSEIYDIVIGQGDICYKQK